MNNVELLMPAGNIEKMKYAINYGADAVYLGVVDFSLRSMKSGDVITSQNIKEAIDTAHSMGANAYTTLNIYAHNEDVEKLPEMIELLADAKPDGIIFSDVGVYSLLKKYAPNIPIHVSTQANTLNYEAVKFWQDLGASRVILARELSLKEIEKISSKVPDIELEAFVHGSMCMSYSGRCLLSNYMTQGERRSNQGGCAQPCRWNYKIVEEKRPGQYIPVEEDERGTYLLNPKDLALINYIPQLIEAGVSSLKIEGRTKSVYYASMASKIYKKAIDAHYQGKKLDEYELIEELMQLGNRGFSTGFLKDKPDGSHYDYEANKSYAKSSFIGLVKELQTNSLYVLAKNQMKVGQEVEIITPKSEIKTKIATISNKKNESVDVANTNELINLTFEHDICNLELIEFGLIRRKNDFV